MNGFAKRICCISSTLGQPFILLMVLSVSFLIIHRAPTITGTVVILRCQFFFFHFLFPGFCIYLYFLIWCNLLTLTYQLEVMFFVAFFYFLNHNIWSIALHSSNSLDSKFLENWISFAYNNLLGLISTIWYSIVFSNEYFVPSVGAVKYTNCFSANGLDCSNECLGYDTKQLDGEVSVMLEVWRIWSTHSQVHSGPEW